LTGFPDMDTRHIIATRNVSLLCDEQICCKLEGLQQSTLQAIFDLVNCDISF
jgi:hypothetical protein